MMQEQLPEDLLRVDLLFRKAHESGIIIQVNLCFCQMFLLAPLLKKNSLYFFVPLVMLLRYVASFSTIVITTWFFLI